MTDRGPSRLQTMRSVVHPAIAVLTPFAFLATVDGLVRGALLGGVVPPPAAAFRLLVFLAGAAETASANFLERERLGGFGARLRELVLVLAGAGLAAWVLSGRPFRGEFSPLAFAVLWPVFLAGVQWLMTASVQGLLRRRELFLSLLDGKEAAALKLAAREASLEAGDAAEGLGRLRTMIVVLETVVLLLLVIAYLARGGEGGWWVPVAVGHEVFGVFMMSVCAGFAYEQGLAAAGVSARDGRPGRRTAAAAAALAILLAAALAASGARPALPLSVLAAVLGALSRLFSPRGGVVAAPAPFAPPRARDDGMRGMLEMLAARETPAWVAITLRVLGYALAAAAAAAVLYFMVRPLLARDTRALLGGLHPLAGLRRAVRKLAALVAGIPRAMAAWLREGGRGAVRVLQAAAESGSGPAGARRRRAGRRGGGQPASRPTREFVRVVRWGERQGVRYDRGEGPREYAARLAAAVPARARDLAAAAGAYEGIVYAGAPRPSLERELSTLVRAIVRRSR